MLPQRQPMRDGRTRTALLAGGSVAGLLLLVLVAHPQLLPWNASTGPGGNTVAAAALLDPEPLAGGEEQAVDVDMLQQQRMIESIYQQAEAIQEDELAKLPQGAFDSSIVLKHPENAAMNLKFLWDFFPASYNCPLREKVGIQHGLGDNGKWVCGLRSLLKRSPCIVYSFGSNGETSFEQDILRATKCEVHVFDPALSEEQRKQVAAIHGLTLHDYGLGVKDGQVAVASARQTMGRQLAGFAVKTLPSIMRELHHDWVDVVKMDVEGAEWAVLDAMVREKEPLPFTQLQVEYHYYPDGAASRPPVMLAVLQGLKRRGLRAFSVEPNTWWANNGHDVVEYAYIQVSSDGNIVTSRRSGRRPGAAGALGRLAHAGAGPHAPGLGSHARHAPQPQLMPST